MLNEQVDRLLLKDCDGACEDEVQSVIDDEIFFKFNSVNLIIGKRGSGKTYTTAREALKLALAPNTPYTQIFYITDKVRDDTFERIAKHIIEAGIQISWVKTEEAVKLIKTLSQAKANLANQDWVKEHSDDAKVFRDCLNFHGSGGIPHTLIIFDDCIGLFKKDSALSKKLFENRQSRITYILILQDVQGISPSMKANIDALLLFGGFPRNKWNILMYQLPPLGDFEYDDYQQLSPHDYVLFDYVDNSVLVKQRY